MLSRGGRQDVFFVLYEHGYAIVGSVSVSEFWSFAFANDVRAERVTDETTIVTAQFFTDIGTDGRPFEFPVGVAISTPIYACTNDFRGV